ncbi:MAG: outer membrane protein assembly factor [Flavobacterium sp.]
MENDVMVNGEKKNEDVLNDQLYQLPNSNLLGYRLRLHLYNLAKPNADSSYKAWLDRKPGRHERMRKILSEKQVQRLGNSFVVSGLSDFLKKTGEPPVVVDMTRVKKSRSRLSAYHHKRGYFRNKVSYKVDTLDVKKAKVTYTVETGKPYMIDSIRPIIETPALDTLYGRIKSGSMIKKGEQFDEANFTGERDRMTSYFRNNGAYTFQQNNIHYVLDTVSTKYEADVKLYVDNESVRHGDSSYTRPFKLYKISKVNIYTKNPTEEEQAIDSVSYEGFNLYSTGKLNYRPKAITDAVFITPGSTFSDFRRVLTSRYLSNLRVFNYPQIQYVQDTTDATGSSLITNIYLNPRKKYRFNITADFTHSNIQDFGIQGSLGLSIRNIFKGAEILELSTRGNIGSSRDLAIQDKSFFNVSEYGADVKLSFPRIVFPINTESIIKKEMIPSTLMSFGISRQRNIGLDKESFTGVLSYNWSPRRSNRVTAKLDLFNIQYIRNVNSDNYFNVYESSYDRLNDIANAYASQIPNPDDYFTPQQPGNPRRELQIPDGTTNFVKDVEGEAIILSAADRNNLNSIEERRDRLTQNNLIFASNFTYTTTTRTNLTDNQFFIFKSKIESAGNVLGLVSSLTNDPARSDSGNKMIFDVEYSQYIKGELDFIKHFDLRRGKVLAMRAFFGLAVPYGNLNTIPFTRSYFAGGSNDNRAWQAYRLGPGRSGGVNDFNEANLKMAYSAELRFNLFGKLNGAVFGDVGNIWNVFDAEERDEYTFNGFESFRDLALGTGFGFRYDFSFFVVRFDVGFKTYNPGLPENSRWFKEYNFANSVLNVGINYPF